MEFLFEKAVVELNELKSSLTDELGIKLFVARLDKLHLEISGNKLFKLHYFLEAALKQPEKPVLTFGGAFSNHLAATSFACKALNIRCLGLVRGEKPLLLSHTLLQCINNGMELTFLSREQYSNKNTPAFDAWLLAKFGATHTIPEGGFHPSGAEGASLIYEKIRQLNADYICTAVGTATTLSGLVKTAPLNTTVIGIPVLKNMTDIDERLAYLLGNNTNRKPVFFEEYHFGGYAKKNDTLIAFINDFYNQYSIPLDFVYTAKMMYAVTDKLQSGYFKKGKTIICLHTGGLQGNASLPTGTLVF